MGWVWGHLGVVYDGSHDFYYSEEVSRASLQFRGPWNLTKEPPASLTVPSLCAVSLFLLGFPKSARSRHRAGKHQVQLAPGVVREVEMRVADQEQLTGILCQPR